MASELPSYISTLDICVAAPPPMRKFWLALYSRALVGIVLKSGEIISNLTLYPGPQIRIDRSTGQIWILDRIDT